MKDWFMWGYLGLGAVICVFFLTAVALGWETGWKFSSLVPGRRTGYSSQRYGHYYPATRGRTGFGGGGFGGFFGGK